MAKQNKNEIGVPEAFPRGFDQHEEQQILFILRHTTPLQRLQWVEEMLAMLRTRVEKPKL